jgi:hypothetical protein
MEHMVHFRGWAPIIGFLATWGVVGQARAQGQAWPNAAHVAIYTGTGSMHLRLVPAGSKEAVADCVGICDFSALPGRYTLYTHDASTGADHELSLRIRRSSRFQLQQGDDGLRDAGLVVGITGSVSVVAGLFMVMPLVLSSMCEDWNCTSDDERLVGRIGLGLMLGGIVATPIGFTMFAHNRTKLKLIDESPYEAQSSGPSLRLGVMGVNGGVGLGGVGTF